MGKIFSNSCLRKLGNQMRKPVHFCIFVHLHLLLIQLEDIVNAKCNTFLCYYNVTDGLFHAGKVSAIVNIGNSQCNTKLKFQERRLTVQGWGSWHKILFLLMLILYLLKYCNYSFCIYSMQSVFKNATDRAKTKTHTERARLNSLSFLHTG